MAQSGYTPILIYASGTASAVPLASNMTSSSSGAELALNYADGKLYYKNSSGTVTLLAQSGSSGVTTFSAGTTGLTPNSATSGAITLAGTLAAANGGTGQSSSFTQYGVTYASSTTALATTSAGTTTTVLHGNASGAPTFGAVSLTADVSGTLPLANGGTNATSAPAAMGVLTGFTTTATAAGTTTLTNTSSYYQIFTGTTTQTIQLPVTSTLAQGWAFKVVNVSTGLLTINSSGANAVTTVPPNSAVIVTCILTSGTTAASWNYGATEFQTSAAAQFGSFGVGTAASGTTGEIRATNNVTAYYSSDRSLKENIRDIPNALDKVSAIGGKLFDWTDDYIQQHGGEDGYFVRKEDFGVIAQDVQPVLPEAVRTREDGTLAVDYEKLAALAFAAIVELRKEIEELKAK